MNSEVISEIRNAFKINSATERTPNAIPVIEVGTKCVKNAFTSYGTATNATSANILVITSASFANKAVYITGATLSVIKDATSTSVLSAIRYTDENGSSTNLLNIPGITLTPQAQSIAINFSHPLKASLSSAITVTNSTNVGNVTATGTIYYYTEDISNA